MNKIIFITIFAMSWLVSTAQEQLVFTLNDSVYIRNCIVNPLKEISERHNSVPLYQYPFNIDGFDDVDKKRNYDLWQKKLDARINLTIYFLNQLSDYADFSSKPNTKHVPFYLPRCYYELNVQPSSIEDIKDRECREKCIKAIDDNNRLLAKNDFEKAIKVGYMKTIHYICSYLQNDKDIKIEQIYKIAKKGFDSEKKFENFTFELNSYQEN